MRSLDEAATQLFGRLEEVGSPLLQGIESDPANSGLARLIVDGIGCGVAMSNGALRLLCFCSFAMSAKLKKEPFNDCARLIDDVLNALCHRGVVTTRKEANDLGNDVFMWALGDRGEQTYRSCLTADESERTVSALRALARSLPADRDDIMLAYAAPTDNAFVDKLEWESWKDFYIRFRSPAKSLCKVEQKPHHSLHAFSQRVPHWQELQQAS